MTNDILDELGAIASNEWERTEAPLTRVARLYGMAEYEPRQAKRYRIFDENERPFVCDLCNCNKWEYRGGEFVCDHSRDEEFAGVKMFVGRIVKIEKVKYIS